MPQSLAKGLRTEDRRQAPQAAIVTGLDFMYQAI